MPEDPERLAKLKAHCAYREPSQHPDGADGLEGPAWDSLQRWMDRNSTNGVVAMLVYLAERYGLTIDEAYSAQADRRLPRKGEHPAYLAETKARCGYVEPPAYLTEATRGYYLGDAPWTALHDWLDANTTDGNTALLVYLAERYDQTISEAYAATDGYAKRRDPDYVNYN